MYLSVLGPLEIHPPCDAFMCSAYTFSAFHMLCVEVCALHLSLKDVRAPSLAPSAPDCGPFTLSCAATWAAGSAQPPADAGHWSLSSHMPSVTSHSFLSLRPRMETKCWSQMTNPNSSRSSRCAAYSSWPEHAQGYDFLMQWIGDNESVTETATLSICSVTRQIFPDSDTFEG